MFRTNDPNIYHVDTLNAMESLGLAFTLGALSGIPRNHKRKRAFMRASIVTMLENKLKEANG